MIVTSLSSRALLSLSCALLFSSCAGSSVTVHARDAKRIYSTAEIYNADTKHPELSQQITRAIAYELQSRGISVTTRATADAPSETADLLIIHTSDWPWDVVRYLWWLEIKLLDRSLNEVIGAGTYQGETFHDYPQPAVVVGGIFKDFDRRHVFSPRPIGGAYYPSAE